MLPLNKNQLISKCILGNFKCFKSNGGGLPTLESSQFKLFPKLGQRGGGVVIKFLIFPNDLGEGGGARRLWTFPLFVTFLF